MIIPTALASIAAFLGALWFLDVVRVAADALAVARGALTTIHDQNLDDAARERAARRASRQLIAAFASLLARGAAAVAAALLPVWLADWAGLAPYRQVIEFLSRWEVISISTGVIICGYVVGIRLRPSR